MVCQCDMLVIGSREVRLVSVSMLECCLLNVRRQISITARINRSDHLFQS